MQYHAWSDRRFFLDMTEKAAKDYFRAWIEKPECPWYVKEQYIKENSTRLRGVRRQSERQAQAASPQHQGYEERLAALVEQKDFAGAAALEALSEQA